MPYEPEYDSGKYDGELAEEAHEEFLRECARLDMAQGIRPTYWDEPEELACEGGRDD